MRLGISLTLVVFVALGCAPAAPSSIRSSAPPSPTAPAAASASPSAPAATLAPASASPAPAVSPLLIDWEHVATVGLDLTLDDMGVRVVVTGEGTLLVLGTRQDPATEEYAPIPTIWWSADGRMWSKANLPDVLPNRDEIWDIAGGDFGAIAVGRSGPDAAVWLSSDGRTWERIHDSGFQPGDMRMVGSTPKGLVAFGPGTPAASDPRPQIWTSADGHDWLRATNETGLRVADGISALIAAPDRVMAFVGSSETRDLGDRVEVWETSGRAEWRRVATLVDPGGISAAAHGPRGWIALGEATWTSVDGRSWTERPQAPGPTVAATDVGFISASSTYTGGGGCIEPWPNFAEGRTWTSLDGGAWQMMPADPQFDRAAIFEFVVRGRSIFGFGGSFVEGEGIVRLAVWSATLPEATGAGRDDARPPEGDTGEGCGP
jgi:hypothetical protein